VRLVSWNVNGIRAVSKKGAFQPCLDLLAPDVLCLQETKAEQDQSDAVAPGLSEHWNSASKKGYSGTAIFTRSEPLSVAFGLPATATKKFPMADDDFGDPNGEGRVICAEYPGFYLINVYTPNSKPDLRRLALRHKLWDPAFLGYLTALEATKPVVVCGDLNVAHMPDDLANPKTNVGKQGYTAEEREGFQNFLDAGFVDTFRMFHEGNGHYSWWSNFANSRDRNVGWRIDYFLVSAALKDRVTAAAIHPELYGSDHCPVSLTLAD
jgi:exodeoxyribonuclease III